MATRGGWVVFCGHLLGLLKASEPSRQSAGRTRLLAGGVDVKATEQSCLLGSCSSRLVQEGPRVAGPHLSRAGATSQSWDGSHHHGAGRTHTHIGCRQDFHKYHVINWPLFIHSFPV